MKVLASNDVLEFVELGVDESQRPHFMTHDLQLLDQRADWAMQLLLAWGTAEAMSDILANVGRKEHKEVKQVPPQELVMRICEVVDAAWNEMQHRGWIVNTGSLGK